MEIILAKSCQSLTGSLSKKLGYAIRRHGEKFYGVRKAKGKVPADGHWQFISVCAEMTKHKIFIEDVKVPKAEVIAALQEAGRTTPSYCISTNPETYPEMFTANDVLKLQKDFNL